MAMSTIISDAFAYDVDEASFYPLRYSSSDVRGGGGGAGSTDFRVRNLIRNDHMISGANCWPGRRPPATKSLPIFGSAGNGNLDNWQKRHPRNWSNDDVLDLIYFVASASGGVTMTSLHGERFRDVRGVDLYRMDRREFVARDPRYGNLLFDCIQELLAKSEFMPPDELETAVTWDKPPSDDEDEGHVSPGPDMSCADAQDYGHLPKPVADLMMEDDEPPPLNLAPGCPCDVMPDDCRNVSPFVHIYGHKYEIDKSADFRDVLLVQHPTAAQASMEPDDGHCIYTNLTTVRSAGRSYTDSQPYDPSAPIDLRTGPYRSDVQPTGSRPPSPPPGLWPLQPTDYPRPTIRLPPTTTAAAAGRSSTATIAAAAAAAAATRAGDWKTSAVPAKGRTTTTTTKKPRNGEDKSGSKAKSKGPKGAKPDGSSGGRHLWEFIRDLLRSSDKGEQSADAIIRWENRAEGIFRIIDSKQVAQLWGCRKRNQTMTYEKLSRALRWSRTFGFLSSVPKDGRYPKKLCFRFGPLANWRDD